jgi:hypothetical protein
VAEGGGQLVLTNSVLTSLALSMLSFFEVPRGILEKIDYYRFHFYWQSNNHKRKYRLARWNIICQPKDQGELGIQNIDIQNQCLLSKWLFKLINENNLWQNIKKNISVAYVFSRIPLNITFHRDLVGNNLRLWHNLVGRIAHVRLNDREDMFKWSLHQNDIFSVKSMYQALICDDMVWYGMIL